MKINIIILISCTLLISCNNTEQNEMREKETIVEMALFKTNKEIKREDDQFWDIIYWTDLQSAKTASEKVMKNPKTLETFKIMDEKDMVFKYFSVFNELEKNK